MKNKTILVLVALFIGFSTFTAQGAWGPVPTANFGAVHFKSIGVGSANHIWATDKDNKIYQWTGSDWKRIQQGLLLRVAVSSDGKVRGIDLNGNARAWTGRGWALPAGKLIDTDVEKEHWGLDTKGVPRKWHSLLGWRPQMHQTPITGHWRTQGGHYFPATWDQHFIPQLKRISVSKVGKVIALGIDDIAYLLTTRTYSVRIPPSIFRPFEGEKFKKDAKAWGWTPIIDQSKLIAVDLGKYCWGVRQNGTPVVLTAGGWEDVPGEKLTTISSAEDGTTWGINSEGKIVKWVGPVPGSPLTIDNLEQAFKPFLSIKKTQPWQL